MSLDERQRNTLGWNKLYMDDPTASIDLPSPMGALPPLNRLAVRCVVTWCVCASTW